MVLLDGARFAADNSLRPTNSWNDHDDPEVGGFRLAGPIAPKHVRPSPEVHFSARPAEAPWAEVWRRRLAGVRLRALECYAKTCIELGGTELPGAQTALLRAVTAMLASWFVLVVAPGA